MIIYATLSYHFRKSNSYKYKRRPANTSPDSQIQARRANANQDLQMQAHTCKYKPKPANTMPDMQIQARTRLGFCLFRPGLGGQGRRRWKLGGARGQAAPGFPGPQGPWASGPYLLLNLEYQGGPVHTPNVSPDLQLEAQN